MGFALGWFGKRLARFLANPMHVHGTGQAVRPERLLACLEPGDVLLVEGNSRVSTAIKYLTQSTWSHTALYVGAHLAEAGGTPDAPAATYSKQVLEKKFAQSTSIQLVSLPSVPAY